MRQFFKSRKESIVLVAILIGHLILLSSQLPQPRSTPLLRAWAMELILPMLQGTVGSVSGLSNFWGRYTQLRVGKQEYESLKNQVAKYRQAVVIYEEELRRIGRLSLLNKVRSLLKRPSIPAGVIGGDSRRWFSSRVVDKGSNSGISRDCPVINADGVVGRILHVSWNSAVVQLISDLDSGVGVLLENSRAQGVLKGLGKQNATIHYVSKTETVLPGEQVITSGLDQIYPKGLLVGIVLSATHGKTVFQEVQVSISANLQKLEEVLVLKKESPG